MIYWKPVNIPPGGTYSFITFAGMGVADHAMSDAYQLTQGSVTPAGETQQGFIAAAQTPFALPLIKGDADSVLNADGVTRSPLDYTLTAYVQNEWQFSMASTFAFVQLPPGLQFAADNPNQQNRLSTGSLGAVGSGLDEGSANWSIQPTGIEAGMEPINLTYGNALQDSAQLTRMINVPQGRLFQFGNDWRMITFPFTYNALANDPATVFGLAPGSFQVVQYNPQTSQYEAVTQLQAGGSYWVRMLGLGNTFVRANGASPIKLSPTDVFETTVPAGWDQVGNPSPYVVRVADLQFLQPGGTTLTFAQAVAAGYIRSTLYSYNRTTQQYVALNKDSLISPGAGVWMYATAERSIIWPAPQGPKLSITP